MKNQELQSKGEIIIYQNEEGVSEIDVKLAEESVWLNQSQMAILFNKNSDTTGLHIRNIYEEEELEINSTTEEFSVVQKEGKREVTRKIKFYNLDMIISVDY
jgi:hypothetical protein